MATILLNGVATDASSLSPTDNADKLTVRGSEDGLTVNLAGGDDLLEIYAASEKLVNVELRLGTGNDEIQVRAEDGTLFNNVNEADDFVGLPMTLSGLVTGGQGDDEIDLGDGLVTLTGTVKGNEGEDTIDIARVDGGTVQGLQDDDNINIGFSGFTFGEAGSQAEVSLKGASINGSKGDDTIDVSGDAVLTDSSIRGNEGDDTIVIADGATAAGSVSIEGNAGDDTIDAADLAGTATIRGGGGNDTLIAGNGQTVFGGLGADTFQVGASGGVIIEDFDKLDLDGVSDVDNDDCFCDDSINIENIAFETATYSVERVKFTSKSSWTGDIKVKAVADADNCPATATAKLAGTKTETLTAYAVARLNIEETNLLPPAKAKAALGTNSKYAIAYPKVGNTINGETFANGLGTNGAAGGKGRAYASAEGFWYKSGTSGAGLIRTLNGAINNISISTNVAFEKGDFSFLALTKTAKAGCTTNQKLTYDLVSQATVKNHHAEYNKVKNTGNDVNLYSMNFGTANFNEVITGKAYMVLTDIELTKNQIVEKTLTATVVGATAKVTLDLENYFQAWKRVDVGAASATTASSNGDYSFAPLLYSGIGRAVTKDVAKYSNGAGFVDNKYVTYNSLQARNELTLTTTARNTGNATKNGQTNVKNVVQKLGINNTARTKDDYLTARGELVVKIAVSETATAKATKTLGTVVDRLTLTKQQLDVTTCPDFPQLSSLASRFVDGQAKQGDVVGTFNTKYLWANENLNLQAKAFNFGDGTKTGEDLIGFSKRAGAGDGFFSAAAFTTDALEAEDFGRNAVVQAGDTDAKDVPFRVLFFDNEGSDNGLYIMSGVAGYNKNELTAINVAATSSSFGGKHTIVKVAGGKGKEIELSDINFI